MKKYLILVIIALSACQEDEVKPERGCLTGVLKGTTTRVTIKCCTEEEFRMGSHETPNWGDFTGHQWGPCSDCN